MLRSMSTEILRLDNPATGEIVVEVPYVTSHDLDDIVSRAHDAQRILASWSLEERVALCERWIVALESRSDAVARDITLQMGKPLAQSVGEVQGTISRARAMMALAHSRLAPETLPPKDGFERLILHEPVGVVLDIAAWNYPLLIAVNVVVPGVLAGDAILLKHSERSPLCGDAFAETFAEAGAPTDLVQAVHCSHDTTAALVAHSGVDYVSFTGSVRGGRAVHSAAAGQFKQVGLELGGKDPAYICADADFSSAVTNMVEGATYNAGQSCCAIERVYVDASIYDRFVDAALAEMKKLRQGDPMVDGVDVGPMAQPAALGLLEAHISDAAERGARILVGGQSHTVDGAGRYFEPTLVADADHSMHIMTEETFGPILAVAPVTSDAEAIEKMNDSVYGLTASIWTGDLERARRMAPQLRTGTVFLNRCDYLDPLLPWSGTKDSGCGVSLSHHGFTPLTRLKSIHFRLPA